MMTSGDDENGENAIPVELEPVGEAFAEFLRVTEEELDFSEPEQSEQRFRAAMHGMATSVNLIGELSQESLTELVRLVEGSSFHEELAAQIEENARETFASPEGRALWNLLEAADAAMPGAPMVAAHLGIPGVSADAGIIFRGSDLLHEAGEATGTKRARSVARAIRPIVETTYATYMGAMWFLALASRGETPRTKLKTIGHLNRVCAAAPELCDLVDPKASWLRNSVAHESHRVEPDGSRVTFWDRNGQQLVLPTDELVERVTGLYAMAVEVFPRVVSTYISKRTYVDLGLGEFAERELVPVILKALAGEEPVDPELVPAMEEMGKRLESAFSGVNRIGAP